MSVDTTWTRAACANGACAEVRRYAGYVQIRNSTNPSAVVSFTPAEWAALAAGVKAGEFDTPEADGVH